MSGAIHAMSLPPDIFLVALQSCLQGAQSGAIGGPLGSDLRPLAPLGGAFLMLLTEMESHSSLHCGSVKGSVPALDGRLSLTQRLTMFYTACCTLDATVTIKCESTPGQEEVVIVGCGLAGLTTAMELTEAGASLTILERSASVGGVWRWDSNPYSRVNSTEPCYRLRIERVRANTNH